MTDNNANSENFDQYCVKAAGRFISTVLAIDDDPGFQSTYGDGEDDTERKFKADAKKPTKGLSGSNKSKSKITADTPADRDKEIAENGDQGQGGDDDSASSLDAEKLVQEFADRKILCSVFAPKGGDQEQIDAHVLRAERLATCSDAIILDWDLKGAGGSGTARKILRRVVSEDIAGRPRLRLIIIYTKENAIGVVLNDISSELFRGDEPVMESGDISIDRDTAVISFPGTRIAIINKSSTLSSEIKSIVVSEQDLPDRLIEEFAALTRGLLPSIALHSVAAVRESTFHLLATLSADFDPAIIAHRCLLPNPEDAANFCLDMISDEMRSAMSLNRIGRTYGRASDFIECAKALNENENFNFRNDQEDFHFTLEDMEKAVREGDDGSKVAVSEALNRWQSEHSGADNKHSFGPQTKILESLLQGDDKKAGQVNRTFSQITGLKREAHGKRHLPEGWAPTLILGSIIREETTGKLFICVQPRCDCFRLKGPRSFPFLTLSQSKPLKQKYIAIALRVDPEEDEEIYYVAPVPHQQKLIQFEPTEDERVMADKVNADKVNYVFVIAPQKGADQEGVENQEGEEKKDTTAKKRFFWIADLKDERAQKIVNLLAGRQGSVGIDDYEWLRRKGRQ